jgi:UDP-glucose 4-epimerase
VGNRDAVTTLLRQHRIEAVLHCAARSLVAQSMREPGLYYAENVVGGVALLDALREAGVDRIVFSSTAAVYGEPEDVPVHESAPTRPVNPYGASKLAFEGAMAWYAAYGLRSVSLRYFNVAGASERYGERHDPETHLIPNLLRAASGGPELTIFGRDYPTPDGTAVRDYIHVLDLADAHIAALEMTASVSATHIACNLGSGSGFSVIEMLNAAETVVGHEVPHTFAPRREGDPAVLVASNAKAFEMLGWQPRRGTLDEMIGSAWRWHQAHPQGYRE